MSSEEPELTDDLITRIDSATSIRDISLCIKSYYEDLDNPVGGSLHVVLDDYNYADSHIEYCIDYAVEQGDRAGEALGRKLLTLSIEERAEANQFDCD